jgi:putative transposase
MITRRGSRREPAAAGAPFLQVAVDISYATHIYRRMARDRYAKNAGVVCSLKYHVAWCPKYRRPVLVPPVDRRLKELVNEVATEYGFVVHEMEVMPDHVRLVVAADPTRSVAEIVNRFKGATSRFLRQEFPRLRSRLPTLWSRSYFAATVGAVTEAAVRRYIENQKGK